MEIENERLENDLIAQNVCNSNSNFKQHKTK